MLCKVTHCAGRVSANTSCHPPLCNTPYKYMEFAEFSKDLQHNERECVYIYHLNGLGLQSLGEDSDSKSPPFSNICPRYQVIDIGK